MNALFVVKNTIEIRKLYIKILKEKNGKNAKKYL